MELQTINEPIDIAELFNDIHLGLPDVKQLYIHIHYTQDPTLDMEEVSKLPRPDFEHLEKLLFAIFAASRADLANNMDLFEPVFQRLFFGTPVQLQTESTNYRHERGYLQTWGSIQLDGKMSDNCWRFRKTYPSWNQVGLLTTLMRSMRLVAGEMLPFYNDKIILVLLGLVATGAIILVVFYGYDPLTFLALTIFYKILLSAIIVYFRSMKTQNPGIQEVAEEEEDVDLE